MIGSLYLMMIIVGLAMLVGAAISKANKENKRKLVIIGSVLIVAPLLFIVFLNVMFSLFFP